MNTVQRIAKNTVVLFVANIISKVLSFFYIMHTARYLGAEGFGILSFALAFTGIFGVFSDLGLGPLTVREVARDKSLAKKYLNNISVMKAILVPITFALIAIVINLLGYPEQTIKVVYLISLSVVFNSFTGMFNSIFQAFEKMEYQSLGQILKSALMLSGALFAISQGFSVVGFASIYFLVSAVVLGYSFAVCAWKFVKPKMEIDWGFWKPTIKVAWVFAAGSFFASIYFMIDRVMLSMMKGDIVVGYYSAAYNLVDVLSFIPSVFAISIFPVMSNYFKTSGSSLNKIYNYSVKYMFTLALPITVGVILLSKRIIYIIYGTEFLASTPALNVLIWAETLMFVGMIMSYMLVSIDKQKIALLNVGVGATLNVALNFLLIPKMSLIGAAIACVASDIYFFASSIYFLSKYGYKLNFSLIIIKPLFASIIMGGFIYHLNSLNLLALVLLSALLYFGVLYMIGGVDREDASFFKQILKVVSVK